jgi:hypothetical protein
VFKNGHQGCKQRYFCKNCGRQYVARKPVDTGALWCDYVFKKQTLVELSANYGISVSSIRRHLKKHRSVRIISSDKQVVVLVDATYCGRSFGVIVFKDAQRKKIFRRGVSRPSRSEQENCPNTGKSVTFATKKILSSMICNSKNRYADGTAETVKKIYRSFMAYIYELWASLRTAQRETEKPRAESGGKITNFKFYVSKN